MKLKMGDSFNYISDVMGNVFGWNYKSYFRGFYYLDDEKKYGAWFPKLAKGPKEPGDQWHGWVNTMSNDGKYIYMKNYSEPNRMSKSKDKFETLHITFVKKPSEKYYRYAGCYQRTDLDPELGWVYVRVEEDTDTAKYHLIPRIVKR